MLVRWLWLGFLAIGLALTVVVLVVPGTLVADLVWIGAGLLSALALALGPLLHHPASSWVWYVLALGLTSWVLSAAVLAVLPEQDAAATWLPAVLHWVATVLVVVGLLGFSQRHTTDHVIPTLDSAIATAAAVMLMWTFVALPAWSTGSGGDRWFDAARPFSFALMFGVFYRLGYTAGRGRVAAQGITVVLGLVIGYQSLARSTGMAVLDNRPMTTALHWLIAFVLAGTLALHPDSRALTEPTPPRPPRPHWFQVAMLTTALVVGPGAIASRLFSGAPVPPVGAALLYLLLVGLVSARMMVMVRRVNVQATTDHLTGLPNRRALHRVGQVRLTPGTRQALLLLDLDRFKEVNDSLGHHAGDALLTEVAGRLRSRLRTEDLLVRLGGDEFAVLLDDVDGAGAVAVARDLVETLEAPFALDELTVHSGGSIGVALFPDHGADLPALLRRADAAMYRAKGTDGGVAQAGDEAGEDRLRTSEEFRVALQRGELVLHYQPKVDLGTGTAVGVEALVRWQHPVHGLMLPGQFLPLVEESGLMRAMTRVALGLALDQMAAWRAEGRLLPVAVNLSASSLTDAALPTEVAAMLAARDLPPSALELEITEEFLMADRARARAVLGALRAAGIRIAVDDFGTGYSSLAYLRDLPIDELKLDRSFVFPMATDPRASALVGSTVALAHSLGLRMVAEGVEDGAAYDELGRLGCDIAQGYWLSRPLPADELARWLTRPGPVRPATVAAGPARTSASGPRTPGRPRTAASDAPPPSGP